MHILASVCVHSIYTLSSLAKKGCQIRPQYCTQFKEKNMSRHIIAAFSRFFLRRSVGSEREKKNQFPSRKRKKRFFCVPLELGQEESGSFIQVQAHRVCVCDCYLHTYWCRYACEYNMCASTQGNQVKKAFFSGSVRLDPGPQMLHVLIEPTLNKAFQRLSSIC